MFSRQHQFAVTLEHLYSSLHHISVYLKDYYIMDKSSHVVVPLQLCQKPNQSAEQYVAEKASLNGGRKKKTRCDYLASRRIGSRGGYMDLTTSSTLRDRTVWGGGLSLSQYNVVMWGRGELFTLPRADAFCHGDNITQAGRCFNLCPRAHRHGNQLLSQSVADLHVEIQRVSIESVRAENDIWNEDSPISQLPLWMLQLNGAWTVCWWYLVVFGAKLVQKCPQEIQIPASQMRIK